MSFDFLQSVVEVAYRRYVRLTGLVSRHSEALELVEKVDDRASASDSAAAKGGPGIKHLDSTLLSGPGKQDAIVFIAAAAALTKDHTK